MGDSNPTKAHARAATLFRGFTVALLTATALALGLGGFGLLALGGSPYYLAAALWILAVAVLLARRSRTARPLYDLFLLATVAWSLWEVGFDGWALMPRLIFFLFVWAWLRIPLLWRDAVPSGRGASRALRATMVLAGILLTGLAIFRLPTSSEGSPPSLADARGLAQGAGTWEHYGNDLGGSRYSPLAEMTPSNVKRLERAWVFRAGESQPGGQRKGGLQVTPLMADGVVYGCTAFSSVFALDPVSGRQLWRHDPVVEKDRGGHAVCRGLAFFRAPPGVADCPTRLLLGTVANRLIALDARTGRLCRGFGADGVVDLGEGLGDYPKRWSHPTSPPTIVGGVAVVGAYVVDNQAVDAPPGVVRGYDAVTGALRWAFDPARPTDTAPLPPGQLYTPGTPNSWAVASGDEALGLVYLPMGNSSPDFVGAHRSPVASRFASAVVALDARTGAVRWTFQAIHHDLWDYDIAAQPVLADFPTQTGPVPALFLATKTGQVFVLDRRTGAPLTAVEERAVPASDLPGERAAPTQPFSVGMPDFAGPPLTERDMWGLTPFDQLYCRVRFKEARYQGPFTPPRLGRTIRYPGELGGIDWGSVSVDARRGVLVVNSNHMADLDELITREQADREGLVPRRTAGQHSAPGGPMAGAPYAVHWGPFLTAIEVPCQRPPYGHLTAVDLKTRKVIWRRPLGDARNSGPYRIGTRLPLPLGAPNIGGSLTTGGGLVFIAATQDEVFRAIDLKSGKVLWQEQLPAAGHATPMTYRGADGRQYVLIAAGGRSLRDKGGDHFIAYRLKP
jgi:membrane-bound PQQ-dependent dehydrogenase (glucose/quinate/shikimate family)